jgi:hypothetical protein
MVEAAQTQFARSAFDEEFTLYGIEQAHAFRVERICADGVFSGQEGQLGKFEPEGEPFVVQPDRAVLVGFTDDSIDRRAVDSHDADRYAGWATIR